MPARLASSFRLQDHRRTDRLLPQPYDIVMSCSGPRAAGRASPLGRIADGQRFGLVAFGLRILVEADSNEAHQLLQRSVFPSIDRSQFGTESADLRIRVIRRTDQFHLVVDDQRIKSSSHPSGLLRSVIDCLDRAVIARLKDFHAVHAGAVLIGNRALLVPGPSHSGKSSLVPELLRCGASCFSDEYALIDRQGRVHAYPRPLMIRSSQGDQRFALPEQFNSCVPDVSAPVGWILSLQFSPSSRWNVAETSQGQGMMSLLQNTPHAIADSPGLVASLHRASHTARCYAGLRGEAKDAAGEILQIVSRSA